LGEKVVMCGEFWGEVRAVCRSYIPASASIAVTFSSKKPGVAD